MLEELKEKLSVEKTLTLKIKVHASARETKIKSILSDGTIKIDIAKTPEQGKANEVLIHLLCEEFVVQKNNIEILMGKLSGDKIVKISK